MLWELDTRHLASLDKQEGVPRVYQRRHIEVGTRGREVTLERQLTATTITKLGPGIEASLGKYFGTSAE